jgi:hypothetical protein
LNATPVPLLNSGGTYASQHGVFGFNIPAGTPFVLLQETTNLGPTDKFNISSQQQTFQSQFVYSGVNALYLGGDSGAAAAGVQYVNFVEFGGTHQGTLNIVDTSDDSEFSSDSLRDIS